MILADTSAWVEYDRGTGSPVGERVAALIAAGGPLRVTEPVVMEVVAGARDARREQDLRRLMQGIELLPLRSPDDFESASLIYRRCRGQGVTPRGIVDCMVAAVVWRTGAALLADDRDLAHVARVLGLKLDPASRAG